MSHSNAYRITIVVLLRVHARTGRTIGRHCLIPVLPEMEYVLLFIIMYALHHLWANERAFCYYSFQGYHVIEAVGAKGPRVAGEFAEATNVRAIIHLVKLLGAVEAPGKYDSRHRQMTLARVYSVVRR